MRFRCRSSTLRGEVAIPGSKSHTIRAVAISSLAEGVSRIAAPLVSEDTQAAVRVYRALGARIEQGAEAWQVEGLAGRPAVPADVIDVANSGTSMNMGLGSCALLTEGAAVLTGDDQVRRRPHGPLVDALNDLGAQVFSTRGQGLAPFVVRGTLRGGRTTIECRSSQYLSSLLVNCPLASGDTTIHVPLLYERPYVEMTLWWLQRQGIRLEHQGLEEFQVPGGQRYRPVNMRVPADFSSATFFLAAGALGDNDITSTGLDMSDTQGDKAVVDYLRRMGARVEIEADRIRVRGGDLVGTEIDLNATPDALPMMAVVGCFARGVTRLVNCPQARIKETDRIAAMCAELKKMGADIRELPDGLEVRESRLKPAAVDGRRDHRVVMALTVAGLALKGSGQTVIDTAEAVAVTVPTFSRDMASLGADIEVMSS